MKHYNQSITILIAEDNPEDCMLVKEAFRESGQDYELVFVGDGIELLSYLRHQTPYSDPGSSRRPDLILLDLNMPRKDGRDALAEIKADRDLRAIPVVVLTISNSEADIIQTYTLGSAGFIIKPTTLAEMVEVVKVLNQYWFEVVELSRGDDVKRGNSKK